MAEPTDPEKRRLEEKIENKQGQQEAESHSHQSSPSDFIGNFAGYIEAVQRELELERDDGDTRPVALEARFLAAQRWLVERWGEEFPCPVCRNTVWVVSDVAGGSRPTGYLIFFVTCAYCGNTMQVVPGVAHFVAPQAPQQQKLSEQ